MDVTCIEINYHDGLAEVCLNRPHVYNAFNRKMLEELKLFFESQAVKPVADIIVIKGKGSGFSAGADMGFMYQSGLLPHDQNKQDSSLIRDCLLAIKKCPVPVIAMVHGRVAGGAMGLIAACDIVIAHQHTLFSLPEVRVGLVPAVIYPFLRERLSNAFFKAMALLSRPIDVNLALRSGLIDFIVDSDQEKSLMQSILMDVRIGETNAIKFTKQLTYSDFESRWKALSDEAVDLITQLKSSADFQMRVPEKHKVNGSHS